MIFKISDSVRRDRPSENENLFAFYKFLQCQVSIYEDQLALLYRKLRTMCQKRKLLPTVQNASIANATSTAKQVLVNCKRMVLARFIGNRLSTFIF